MKSEVFNMTIVGFNFNKINVEKKVKSITLRLPEALLNGIKDDAGREGIGYQTLIGCILHKYHHGTLIDVNNLKNAITNI